MAMTPTSELDFGQIRIQYPNAFAALETWAGVAGIALRKRSIFYQHEGVDYVRECHLPINIRDLYDFFDASGIHIGIHFAQANGGFGGSTKWYFYATILHGDCEDLKAYPTRAAAEAAAFQAGFEKLEEILNQKEG